MNATRLTFRPSGQAKLFVRQLGFSFNLFNMSKWRSTCAKVIKFEPRSKLSKCSKLNLIAMNRGTYVCVINLSCQHFLSEPCHSCQCYCVPRKQVCITIACNNLKWFKGHSNKLRMYTSTALTTHKHTQTTYLPYLPTSERYVLSTKNFARSFATPTCQLVTRRTNAHIPTPTNTHALTHPPTHTHPQKRQGARS